MYACTVASGILCGGCPGQRVGSIAQPSLRHCGQQREPHGAGAHQTLLSGCPSFSTYLKDSCPSCSSFCRNSSRAVYAPAAGSTSADDEEAGFPSSPTINKKIAFCQILALATCIKLDVREVNVNL